MPDFSRIFTWIPPQSSMLSPNLIARTVSPYFSPNNAIASSLAE
jgi:hypothetical protein